MLVLVVTLFGFCWLPLHVFILVYDYNQENWTDQMDIYIVVYYCVHWLAMSNSFVNPIIYSIFNKSFRVSEPIFGARCWVTLKELFRDY